MTENMKAFLEQMNQNQALKNELEALGKEQLEKNKDAVTQKAVEIAEKHGFALTAEDMEMETAELTDEQLKAAAGGGGCGCFFIGGGEDWCECIGLGSGLSDNDTVHRCNCEVLGAGWD